MHTAPFTTTRNYVLLLATLLLTGLFYNAGLAFINGHGMRVSTLHVMGVEFLLLAAIGAAAYPLRSKLMTPWLFYSFMFIIIFLGMALVNAFLGQSISPKSARDVFLISAFGILGLIYAQTGSNIVPILRIISIAVIAGLILENFFTTIYTWVFNVASYYENTRGIVDRTLFADTSGGLFVNTQLIEGRFSLGFLTSHRLSSLFLEQTSLANFAIIMGIATSVFWNKLTTKDKVTLLSATLLSVTGTDSRMAFGLMFIVLIMHFVVHAIPRNLNVIYMPALIVLAAFKYYDPYNITLTNDDIGGRFTWSLTQLSWIDHIGYLGGRVDEVVHSMDSGYSYVIYSQSIFGMLMLWLFTSFIIPQTSLAAKRFAHMTSAFLAINLMTGPTILSIKAAALLWFIGGYIYYVETSKLININIKKDT